MKNIELNNELLVAVETKCNNISLLKDMLLKGANVNIKDGLGRPLIHKAMFNNELLKVLISNDRLNINAIDDNFKRTALHLAIENNDLNSVNILIKDNRIDLNIKDKEGDTPLLLSVKKEFCPIVDALMASGADVNLQDANGDSPIGVATKRKNIEIFKSLIMNPKVDLNIADKDGNCPLHISSSNGCPGFDLLINDPRCDVNKINKNEMTPFFLAISKGNEECANKFCESKKANNRYKGSSKTALNLAAKLGNVNLFGTIINAFSDEVNIVDGRGNNPLFAAIINRNYNISQILIDKIQNINFKNNSGFTCLHYAASLDDRRTIELLLTRKDLNINIRDINKDTALTKAIGANKIAASQLLIVNLNLEDKEYIAELIDLIIKKSRKRIAEYLVNLYPNIKLELQKYFVKAIKENDIDLMRSTLNLIGKRKVASTVLGDDTFIDLVDNKKYEIFELILQSNKFKLELNEIELEKVITCLCTNYKEKIFDSFIESINSKHILPYMDKMKKIAQDLNNHVLIKKLELIIKN